MKELLILAGIMLLLLLIIFLTNSNTEETSQRDDQPKPQQWRRIVYMQSPHPENAIKEAVQKGFNVIILAFLTGDGAMDATLAWRDYPRQTDIINYAHQHNAIVLASAGGPYSAPYIKYKGDSYGEAMAKWVVRHNLDGLDFYIDSLEPGFCYGDINSDKIIKWLVDASRAAREVLGPGSIVTHSVPAPYFGSRGGTNWPGYSGGYSTVYKQVPDIDWFNIRFYQQNCYNSDYQSLFINSDYDCPVLPGSAVKEIVAHGIPINKIVLAKPTQPDVDGYIDPQLFQGWLNRATIDLGWQAGLCLWQWDDQAGSYLRKSFASFFSTTPNNHEQTPSS